MATSYFGDRISSPVVDSGASVLSPTTSTSAAPRSNALQNRITGVLSASYADLEIRDALTTLDTRGLQNTAESRRNLRLDVQQELIECNGEIVQDFGKVAEQLKRIGNLLPYLVQLLTPQLIDRCTTGRSLSGKDGRSSIAQ